jgi:glycosyltransferase involved in cell wall biosynthesis
MVCDTLKRNIQSVLQQQYKDFVFLICDDHSTDGSWDYLNTLNDPRISLYRNKQNKGLFGTLNFLCKQADARLIKIWSQDDVMNPACLAETIAFHKKYPAISFSYSAFEVIDEEGRVVTHEFNDVTPEYIPRALHDRIALYTGSIAGNICNVTIIKERLAEVGYFDESMTIAADFDMWVKLTEKYDIGMIKEKLVCQRVHTRQLSRAPEPISCICVKNEGYSKIYWIGWMNNQKPLVVKTSGGGRIHYTLVSCFNQ